MTWQCICPYHFSFLLFITLSNADIQLIIVELISESQVTFQDFPAEIILIIFVYTLPEGVLDQKQPNMKITPMLLCHICSQWQSNALQLPRLWMCLYHVIHITPCMKQELGLLNRVIHPAIEFLEWWCCNLGPNHPFDFHCDAKIEGSYVHQEVKIDCLFKSTSWSLSSTWHSTSTSTIM